MLPRSIARASARILGLAALLAAGPARAYCRTSHCPATGKDSHLCTPASADDCGFALYWPKPRITYSVQKDASTQVPFETIQSTLRAAFHTWASADCGGGATPRIQVVEADPALCHEHEYNKDLGNANIVMFHDDVWPYDNQAHLLALTTVTYDKDTGEIFDADMEINSAQATFTTSDTVVDVDLLSIVTHESGHFLGLAHSPVPSATMVAVYPPQSITLRDLDDDDRDAICDAHPPGPISDACDDTPRHGFSPLCAADQSGPTQTVPADPTCCCGGNDQCEKGVCLATGCCTIAPGGDTPGSGPLGAALAALGALALAARRRARRRR